MRYLRQIQLFGEEDQRKLSESKVLIIGIGGLGCPVLEILASAGIGRIGIVDSDKVDFYNLHRQFLYDENSVGQPKVEVAKNRIKNRNSEIIIDTYYQEVNQKNIFQLIDNYDIIVDCTDNFNTRYLVNDACFIRQKPLVYGAIYHYEGQISVFNVSKNGKITNYRDLFPNPPRRDEVPNCNEAGVLPTISAIIGNFQANEVIKLITKQDVLVHRLLIFNTKNYQSLIVDYDDNANKLYPKNQQEVENYNYQIFCNIDLDGIHSWDELQQFLEQENSVLLDVRNIDETPKVLINNILEIPLSQIENSLERLSFFDNIAVICASGIRSKKACEIINNRISSKNIKNVIGGLNKYMGKI